MSEKRVISNEAGSRKTFFLAEVLNSNTPFRRRTNRVSFCRFCSSVSPYVPGPFCHQLGVAHQSSLRSPSTTMSYSISLFFEGGG